MEPDPNTEKLVSAIEQSYRLIHRDTLGMFVIWAFLARLNMIEEAEWEAYQWRSDLLLIATDEDDRTVLAWKIYWDSFEAERAFVDSVNSIEGIAGGVWRAQPGMFYEMDMVVDTRLPTTLFVAETKDSLERWVNTVGENN
jgi:hypothetical protein